MAKIAKIKANEATSTIRVTLGVSYNDLADVQAFAPEKLNLVDKDGDLTFTVKLRNAGQNYVSPTSVDILPGADLSAPVVFTVPVGTTSRVEKAKLARIQANLVAVEKQVKDVLKSMEGITIEEC